MKFIKNNKVILGMLLLIFIIMVYSFYAYIKKYYSYNYDVMVSEYYTYSEKCKNGEMGAEFCSTLEYPLTPKEKFKEMDAKYFFISVFNESFSRIMCFILPLIIFIMVASKLHNKFSSGAIKNCLMRESFKKYKFNMNKTVVMIAFITPMFIFVFYLISCIFTGFNFNISTDPDVIHSSYFDMWIFNNTAWYLFIHYIILFLVCIFYGNLVCCFLNKNKNVFITIIFSYLTLCAMFTLSDFIVRFIYNTRLTFLCPYLNIVDFFTLYNIEESIYGYILSAFILVLISFAMKEVMLRNKERVIIENEKGII